MRRTARSPRRLAASLSVLLASFAAREALAQAPPISLTHKYSPYEEDTIRDVVKGLGIPLDHDPEGKVIEAIDVVPLEVIEQRDPAPSFLNALHATTKKRVILREVLVRAGDPYRGVLVDETSRNLRTLPQLSLVVTVALQGSAPGKVKLVIITKDVWSLRLGTGITYATGGLEYLLLEPTETNLFGSHHTVLTRYTYTPSAYALGASYRVARLDGRWLSFVSDANAIINNQSGEVEGSYGSVTIARPLYSALTKWAWNTGVVWNDAIARRFVNASLSTYEVPGATPNSVRDTHIPYEYHERQLTEQAAVVRSYGWGIKNDFALGAEMNVRAYRTSDNLSSFAPADVSNFIRTVIPVSDTRVGPFVQWRGYTANYLRILDFETLGLQEDYRLGHDLYLRAYPVTTALGSSRSFFGLYAAAQYTLPLGDGFVRASVDSTTEAQSDQLSDAALGADLRVVTPRLGFGRFVFDASMLDRYRNYLNVKSFLGGDTRLRGFPSSDLVGQDVVSINLEYRSRPVEILSCQLGAALFWDVGDAFDGFSQMSLKQAVGFGLRGLFPQLERVVLRLDVGFPVVIGDAPGVQPWSFVLSFSQAFPQQTVGGTTASGGTGALPTSSGATGLTTVPATGAALGQ